MEQIYLQDFPYFLFILRKFEEDFPFKSQQFEEKTAEYLKLTGKCATISWEQYAIIKRGWNFAEWSEEKNSDYRSRQFDTASFFGLFWILLGQPGKGLDYQYWQYFCNGHFCGSKVFGETKRTGCWKNKRVIEKFWKPLFGLCLFVWNFPYQPKCRPFLYSGQWRDVWFFKKRERVL